MAERVQTRPLQMVSWAEVHRDSRALARALLEKSPDDGPWAGGWKGIVAITRGGMIPAAVLAREMGIRVVEGLSIASYDEQDQGRVRILTRPEAALADDGKGWLLVDDLVDTGATARAAKRLLPHAFLVTLYAKPDGREMTDLYVHEVPQDSWVYFPWDTRTEGGDLVYADPLSGAEP